LQWRIDLSEPPRHVRTLSALSAQGARRSPHHPVVRTVTSGHSGHMGMSLGGIRSRVQPSCDGPVGDGVEMRPPGPLVSASDSARPQALVQNFLRWDRRLSQQGHPTIASSHLPSERTEPGRAASCTGGRAASGIAQEAGLTSADFASFHSIPLLRQCGRRTAPAAICRRRSNARPVAPVENWATVVVSLCRVVGSG